MSPDLIPMARDAVMAVIDHRAASVVLRARTRVVIEILLDEAGFAETTGQRNLERERRLQLRHRYRRGPEHERNRQLEQLFELHDAGVPRQPMTFTAPALINY